MMSLQYLEMLPPENPDDREEYESLRDKFISRDGDFLQDSLSRSKRRPYPAVISTERTQQHSVDDSEITFALDEFDLKFDCARLTPQDREKFAEGFLLHLEKIDRLVDQIKNTKVQEQIESLNSCMGPYIKTASDSLKNLMKNDNKNMFSHKNRKDSFKESEGLEIVGQFSNGEVKHSVFICSNIDEKKGEHLSQSATPDLPKKRAIFINDIISFYHNPLEKSSVAMKEMLSWRPELIPDLYKSEFFTSENSTKYNDDGGKVNSIDCSVIHQMTRIGEASSYLEKGETTPNDQASFGIGQTSHDDVSYASDGDGICMCLEEADLNGPVPGQLVLMGNLLGHPPSISSSSMSSSDSENATRYNRPPYFTLFSDVSFAGKSLSMIIEETSTDIYPCADDTATEKSNSSHAGSKALDASSSGRLKVTIFEEKE